MFGLFGHPKPLLDPDAVQWIFAVYGWAFDHFGESTFIEQTKLVAPTEAFFPVSREERPEAAAVKLFEQVKEHAGLSTWPCRLEKQKDSIPVRVDTFVVVQGVDPSPAGTFSVNGEDVVITYDPDQINKPESFIATMAHELAHYLCATAEHPPPGFPELEEHATDVLAVFTGFGVFLANSAMSFRQYTEVDSQGWSTSTQGYLSQYELTYALALFARLKKLPHRDVLAHLKPSLKSFFKKASKELDRRYATDIFALEQRLILTESHSPD